MSIKTGERLCRMGWGLYGLRRQCPSFGVAIHGSKSSSKALMRFSAKQMTSLIKWVSTLTKLSLIAILTFGRGVFEPNWTPRASSNQCHRKPCMLWKWLWRELRGIRHPACLCLPRFPVWAQFLSAPPKQLCPPTRLEVQQVFPHHLLLMEDFLFPLKGVLYFHFIHPIHVIWTPSFLF